ncbi:hypothetical protein, partial [Pseudomonas proteolytica]|uniref:hypothetical protein n=1 Tax=Pseudomonas proteolytica TaxID=219574 RepID=UPI0030DC901E
MRLRSQGLSLERQKPTLSQRLANQPAGYIYQRLGALRLVQQLNAHKLWRAGLPRAGLRSSPKTQRCGVSVIPHLTYWGCFAAQRGASPLATEALCDCVARVYRSNDRNQRSANALPINP